MWTTHISEWKYQYQMWKSPVPKGKRAGKANVKKYWVVNSEMGIFGLVGHGIVIVPF